MKRNRILLLTAVLLFAALLCLALTACQTKHTHTEITVPGKEATCTETGLTEGKKCSVCDEITAEQAVIPAKGHTEAVVPGKDATCTKTGLTEGKKCSVCDEITVAQTVIPEKGHTEAVVPGKDATCTETGLTEGKKCSVCGEVFVAQVTVPAKGHTYVYGVCTVCGERKPSEGLEFTLNSDEQSYSVTGIGSCKDTNVVIPAAYNGLPVTDIGRGVFQYYSGLTSVMIPNSVTSIGDYAFWKCSNLTSIGIPDSVTNIGSQAFDGTGYYNNASNWKDGVLYIGKHLIRANESQIPASYTVREGTLTIAYSAFYHCSNLTSVVIGNSVTNINDSAFYDCRNLTSVIIGNSVTNIGYSAFEDCGSLTSIVIPDSVTNFDRYTFLDCNRLTSITFKGTKAQWNAIFKNSDWDSNTGSYTVYCTDGEISK